MCLPNLYQSQTALFHVSVGARRLWPERRQVAHVLAEAEAEATAAQGRRGRGGQRSVDAILWDFGITRIENHVVCDLTDSSRVLKLI